MRFRVLKEDRRPFESWDQLDFGDVTCTIPSAIATVYVENVSADDIIVLVYPLWATWNPGAWGGPWTAPWTRRASLRGGEPVDAPLEMSADGLTWRLDFLNMWIARGAGSPVRLRVNSPRAGDLAPFRLAIADNSPIAPLKEEPA